MLDNKPIFEYSDLELKAMGYDIMEQMEILQKNISLIRIEISRRKSSNILSSINQEDLPKMFSETSQNNNSTIDVSSSSDDEVNLLTPLKK